MQDEFLKYLTETCKCSTGNRFLLAVSGGIDSVVMSWLFYKCEIDFSIAHCNFHLRGTESDEDQHFVERLAKSLKKKCYVKDIDVFPMVEADGVSVQMAARTLRYLWFDELVHRFSFDYIAVAHNRNDVVETMLINLSRGCGLRGLSGIKPRSGKIIRPVLFARRQDINIFADDHKLFWREDSTNALNKYIRNRIRHEIIPEFEVINPAFIQNAADTIERLEQNEQLLDYVVAEVKRQIWKEQPDRILVDIQTLSRFPAKETLLYELLKDFGFSGLNIKSVINTFNAHPGKQFITKSHIITKDRTKLVITKSVKPVNEEFELNMDTLSIEYPVSLNFRVCERTSDFSIPTDKHTAALDVSKLTYPLKLRKWRQGDRFIPLGLKGSKKISDYLIDTKVQLPDKQHVWIIESADAVVWIVNHRIDNRFKITPGTENILLIEYSVSQDEY